MAWPRPVPETVFESAPDYGGVTGLWAVAARPADAEHALVVLSFVSGSRALSITGESRSNCASMSMLWNARPAGGIRWVACVMLRQQPNVPATLMRSGWTTVQAHR